MSGGAAGPAGPTDAAGEVVGAWLPASLAATGPLSGSGRTLRLLVPGLREAAAGQHVDVRLTADDGYQAVRSYSLSDVRASAGGAGRVPEIELAVERLDDGEVSPYLVDAMEVGDPIEVRGPIGGWFRWPPTRFEPGSAVQAVMPDPLGAAPVDAAPVQLIAGGSGVAPLVSMLRVRGALAEGPEFRLLHSVRDPASRWFADELDGYAAAGVAEVTTFFTRAAPEGGGRASGRLTERELLDAALPAERHPVVYVCGTNGFVARVAEWLVAAGHDPTRVRTERFGGL